MKVNKGEMKKDRHLKWLNEKRSTPKMLKITGKKLNKKDWQWYGENRKWDHYYIEW